MVRRPIVAICLSVLAVASAAVVAVERADASPRAQRGVGIADVSTGGAHHPWLGSWRVQVGPGGPTVNAYCIRTGGWFPGSPSWPVADIAGPRGATATDRAAMSYLLFRYGNTSDAVTAAALNVALYSLSADQVSPGVRYPTPGHLSVSHAAVRARAIELYQEGIRQRGPWSVKVAAAPHPSDSSKIRTSAHVSGPGGAISGASAFVTITNGDGSGGHRTDAAGNIVIDVAPHNPAVPVRIEVAFAAPATYGTLSDLEVPQRQTVVYGIGTPLQSSASAGVPGGRVSVVKSNTNPAYQDNAGARFELRSTTRNGRLARTLDGNDAVLATDAAGASPKLVMAPGTYWMVETRAPAGQSVGFEATEVRVDAGADVVITATNPADATASLVVSKLDENSGAQLRGARLLVERDHDGTFAWQPLDHDDVTDGIVVSSDEPIVLGGLLAGRYRVTEVGAPPGYTLPEVREIVVDVGVGESVTVDFADTRPAIATKASSHDAIVGDELVDTVVVSGVASWNRGEIEVSLYGPFDSDDAMECDDAMRVAAQTWDVVGAGTYESPPFVVEEPGVYTFMGTWSSLEDGDESTASHECGLEDETVLVRAPVSLTAEKFDATDHERRLEGGMYRLLVATGDLPERLLALLRAGAPSDEPTDEPSHDMPGGNESDPIPESPSSEAMFEDEWSEDGVPPGYVVVGAGVTDVSGEMRFDVWSHARYCLEEIEAPQGYVLDPQLRCTDGALTGEGHPPLELPEHPIHTDVGGAFGAPSGPVAGTVPMLPAALGRLATTGTSPMRLVLAAIAVIAAGGAFLVARRPRPHRI